MSTPTPDALVSTGTEREVLEMFLDMYRAILGRKLAGLPDEQAREHRVPSATTLAGIVGHLASVEREWFQGVLAEDQRYQASAADDGWDIGPHHTVLDILADYERACAQSRATAARFDPDYQVPHPYLGRVSLRWIYVHMIEETARHTGQADILREQTDGAVGFDG